MKRSEIIEAIKQSYSIGVLDSGSDRHYLLGDTIQETAEIILSGLIMDGVFSAGSMEDD